MKFPLCLDVDDSSWPRNGRSLLAKPHAASINRRNITQFFVPLHLLMSFLLWASRNRSTPFFPNDFNCR